MKTSYEVLVVESYSKTFTINASNAKEAHDAIYDQWHNGEITLGPDYMDDLHIDVSEAE